MKFTIDSKEVSKNFQTLTRLFPFAFKRSQGAMGLAIVQDAFTIAPTVPLDTGFLRGSWSVHVGNEKIGGPGDGSVSEQYGVTTIAFNAKYAAAVHEGLAPKGNKKPSLAGSGGGFLGDKMIGGKERHKAIFAREFKKGMGID